MVYLGWNLNSGPREGTFSSVFRGLKEGMGTWLLRKPVSLEGAPHYGLWQHASVQLRVYRYGPEKI